MDPILVKIFAVALTFGQVATGSEPKTSFDPIADQQNVTDLLRAGCAQMRRAFDVEAFNLDDLIATAMDDPEAISGGHVAFRGLKILDLHVAYRQFCKNETIASSPISIKEVIEFYNRTMVDLPDYTRLKGGRLRGASEVFDLNGERFAEVYEQDQRRGWGQLPDIPTPTQQAVIAPPDHPIPSHN